MIVDPSEPYPLEDAWNLYLHGSSDTTTYKTAYRHCLRIADCWAWGRMVRMLPNVKRFLDGRSVLRFDKTMTVTSMSFFKNDIKPEWEDPDNHMGTTITYRNAHTLPDPNNTWIELLAFVAGNTITHVNGVQITQKWSRNGPLVKVDVWLPRHVNSKAAILDLRTRLGVEFDVAPRDGGRRVLTTP